MTADRYAGASQRWAHGAMLVYGPIAAELVAMSPCPLAGRTVLDAGAAFVLNHLTAPAAGLAELVRVTRPRGGVLAAVFSNDSRSQARDRVDAIARDEGWRVPGWYAELKATAAVIGTAHAMAAAARTAGITDVVVAERPVNVAVTEPGQLVSYRLGHAMFAGWLDRIGSRRAAGVACHAAAAIRPIMAPYRPIVVFLAATTPALSP